MYKGMHEAALAPSELTKNMQKQQLAKGLTGVGCKLLDKGLTDVRYDILRKMSQGPSMLKELAVPYILRHPSQYS